MTLLRFEGVSLEYGDQPLLHDVTFAIERGERVCLIGRNGAGKSSTLKLISGEISPDQGTIRFASGMVTGQLAQNLVHDPDATVRDTVAGGLAPVRKLLHEYQELAAVKSTPRSLARLEALQHQIESVDGWGIDQRIDAHLDSLSLPPDEVLSSLSGGWRRRVALARTLIAKPDLLLLDEPTNHLDIQTIRWLEDTMIAWPGSVLFITHDREFLKRLATRIVELDRGNLTSWPGDYDRYLVNREKALEDEARANALFDKKLAEEEVWIRQGIKARRTRNEGRARALQKMRGERAARLNKSGSVRLTMSEGERSGKQVIRARNISYSYGDDALIKDFSLTVQRGDRIGLIGNNGAGKTTLLRLLLGELEPHTGTVKTGTNLQVAYYDQLRNTLDEDKSVAWHVGQGSDYVEVDGRRRHIITYLKDFLFTARRAGTPVSALSGGERNRVMLARLFAQPANLLVMDEPTNDLDIETLEVLEDRLVGYNGTLLIVSHDREFLDNVVTSSLVFESDGTIAEYVGGYSDWLRHGKQLAEVDNRARPAPEPAIATTKKVQETASAPATPTPRRKLSYKFQRELAALPATIEALEKRIAAAEQEVAHADFYSKPYEQVQEKLAGLVTLNAELEALTERWLELEAM